MGETGTKRKSFDIVRLKAVIIKLLSVLIWILIWEVISRMVGLELLVPSVAAVSTRLISMVQTAQFWSITVTSIFRIVTGFAAGTLLGVLLAILTSSSVIAGEFFKPMLSIIRATPIVSFIILALVWLRGGTIPAFISFLMVFPIIWGNVSKGIVQSDGLLLEMAKLYRVSFAYRVRKIYFHSVLPYLGAAATTSMGLAWKAGIAAEVLATPRRAVGTAIYDARIGLQTTDLFAWSIAVILLSVFLERALEKLMHKMSPPEPVGKSFASNELPDHVGAFPSSIPDFKARGDSWRLIAESLKIDYGNEQVIADFSYEFPSRGCIRIEGASGEGKTTLLKAIAGLKVPGKGKLHVEPVSRRPSVAFVFQEDRLIPWISVLENVMLVFNPYKGRKKDRQSQAAIEILGYLGMKKVMHKYPRELSGGMRQRVNLARALVADTDILLLDEPFKGLDSTLKERLIRLLLALKESKLVILVTHDDRDAKRLSDLSVPVRPSPA